MWLRKLIGRTSSSVPSAATPASNDVVDPAVERIAVALTELFKGHGIDCGRHGEWVTPNGKLPALRGSWTLHEHSGRLDIEVLVEPELTICESFAGVATKAPQTYLDDALHNFIVSSFHVLLSALWHHDDPEQVTTETWQIGDQSFTAVIGDVVTRGTSDQPAPPPPHELLPALKRAIRSEPLSANLHWFRFYFGNVKGQHTLEALRDNEPWEAGVEALNSIAWEPTQAFYGARMFLLLRPVAS